MGVLGRRVDFESEVKKKMCDGARKNCEIGSGRERGNNIGWKGRGMIGDGGEEMKGGVWRVK